MLSSLVCSLAKIFGLFPLQICHVVLFPKTTGVPEMMSSFVSANDERKSSLPEFD